MAVAGLSRPAIGPAELDCKLNSGRINQDARLADMTSPSPVMDQCTVEGAIRYSRPMGSVKAKLRRLPTATAIGTGEGDGAESLGPRAEGHLAAGRRQNAGRRLRGAHPYAATDAFCRRARSTFWGNSMRQK